MRVIILAAGKGSRLGFTELPKPLTPLVNGKSILENQLIHLQKHIPLQQVTVVVGYRKEMIIRAFPQLHFVVNPYYFEENTSKSLLKAVAHIDNEDILWMNGDVVFHPSVLQQLFDKKMTCMVVNVGEVGEEEVKYRSDDKGSILEVSKKVVEPEGEALGINYFLKKDFKYLQTALENCKPNDYFEKAIEICIQQGVEVNSLKIATNLCTEVDFPSDLKKANAFLESWQLYSSLNLDFSF